MRALVRAIKHAVQGEDAAVGCDIMSWRIIVIQACEWLRE